MQGKWLLPCWLYELLPSFLTSSGTCHQPKSKKYSNSSFRNQQLSRTELSGTNRDLGGVWSLSLQSAVFALPWLVANKAEDRSMRKHRWKSSEKSNQNFLGTSNVPLSLSWAHFLSLIFGKILLKADNGCLPAVFMLNVAIAPQLEKLPKLIPSPITVADTEAASKEKNFLETEIASAAVVTSPTDICHHLKDDIKQIIVEPKTGFQFPTFLCHDSSQNQIFCSNIQVLVGVGLKNVSVVKLKSIKIYAFGFYVKPDMVKAHFNKKYGVLFPEEVKHDSFFFEELLRHDLEMSVRLMVHYKGLKMSTVRSAFDSSLRKRLKKIKGIEYDDGLDIFNSYFIEDIPLPQGTVIDFQRSHGGQFRTMINGKLIGIIRSHDFCRAFFDIYIGDPPVSSKTKEEIGQRMRQIISSS